MAMVTTTRDGAPRIKPFAWSYSRMKNFETCPKRHYEIDLAKNVSEPQGEQLQWGNYVHDCMAKRCGPKREPLPPNCQLYEPWAVKMIGDVGDIYVEQGLAINRNFTSVGNFDSDAWMRVKCDFVRIHGDVGLAADWKTGRVLDEPVQLALVAACLFAKFPQLYKIRSCYVWLKEDCRSSEDFYRDDMPNVWRSIWSRIEAMENAHRHMNYPPTPSGICMKWCAVKSCPHNGKAFR